MAQMTFMCDAERGIECSGYDTACHKTKMQETKCTLRRIEKAS
ncbi:hypothetical protein [Halomonas sp. NCCP-2165]|nr:hypothetical protein [Halomonas sp. NCCP-2165]GKW48019.1 hypothetical protein NCCP2165_02340 [Halomonas sp. NCCP-2165]